MLLIESDHPEQDLLHGCRASEGAGSSYTPARCKALIMLFCMDRKGVVKAADRAIRLT